MRRQDAIRALQKHADAIRALGVSSLFLFGSTVGETATNSSDLDLFIDYDADSRFSLIELVGIQQLLGRQLGVPIDVTTRDSLDPLLKANIEASAVRVF